MKNMQIIKGDLFKSKCDIITNAVNCIGVMGGGIAYAFSQKYPNMYEEYKQICANKQLKLGRPILQQSGNEDKRLICNFPTMYYPGSEADIAAISLGLDFLADWLEIDGIKNKAYKSIALCALGCGVGGLSFDMFLNILEISKFEQYPGTVEVFKPFKTN